MKSKKAFTLIELLVVVLIIGILSAVALPQYEKAVEKARMTEAFQIIGSLQKAVDVYVLENGFQKVELVGDYSTGEKANLLSVDIENTLDCSGGDKDRCLSKNFSYDSFCDEASCIISSCRTTNSDDFSYCLYAEKASNGGAWQYICATLNTELGKHMCTSVKGTWEYYEGDY